MAGPLMCDTEDGELAIMLISNLGNGDTIALCATCFPGWCVAAAEAFNAAAAQEAARLEEPQPTAAEEGEATPSTPSPKSRRTGDQATPKDLKAESSPFAEVAPDQG